MPCRDCSRSRRERSALHKYVLKTQESIKAHFGLAHMSTRLEVARALRADELALNANLRFIHKVNSAQSNRAISAPIGCGGRRSSGARADDAPPRLGPAEPDGAAAHAGKCRTGKPNPVFPPGTNCAVSYGLLLRFSASAQGLAPPPVLLSRKSRWTFPRFPIASARSRGGPAVLFLPFSASAVQTTTLHSDRNSAPHIPAVLTPFFPTSRRRFLSPRRFFFTPSLPSVPPFSLQRRITHTHTRQTAEQT